MNIKSDIIVTNIIMMEGRKKKFEMKKKLVVRFAYPNWQLYGQGIHFFRHSTWIIWNPPSRIALAVAYNIVRVYFLLFYRPLWNTRLPSYFRFTRLFSNILFTILLASLRSLFRSFLLQIFFVLLRVQRVAFNFCTNFPVLVCWFPFVWLFCYLFNCCT